jgi:hypothetical protein
MAIDKPEVFCLANGGDDAALADAENRELVLWRLQPPVLFAGVTHVLEQEEVDDAARVDASGSPRIAGQKLPGEHDERLALRRALSAHVFLRA